MVDTIAKKGAALKFFRKVHVFVTSPPLAGSVIWEDPSRTSFNRTVYCNIEYIKQHPSMYVVESD